MPHHPSSEDFFGTQFSLPDTEERVLAFWREHKVFENSLERRRKGKRFVFYEGPPSANAMPGIHHLLSRAIKDIILRYKTMRGYYVPRRSGWDTHGLPIELAAEKELGIKSKKEIEAFGIAAFNEKCRALVWQYKAEWEKLTERMGYWLDLEHPYITYEPSYIESLWWVVKQIAAKKLLYQGHKVIPWCPRCGTGLSSHELGQPGAYQKVKDLSVYVKFRLLPGQHIGRLTTDDHTYVLSWTTTPWTLPGNVALAVGANMEYQAVEVPVDPNNANGGKERFILAQDRIADVLQHDAGIGEYWKGSQLVGLQYEPLFDIPDLQTDTSYRIYPADFVTAEDGTGVVHTAVMYGEDDYALGQKVGLPQVHTVTPEGTFNELVPEGLAGLPVKNKETEKKVVTALRERGLLYREQWYEHEYPHCWRCNTPVLYYARTAWFVAMSKLRAQMQQRNNTVNWVPAHLKKGRFGEWLREAKDWNFSRERYWGTPLPVWQCDHGDHQEVIGGLDELSAHLGGAKNSYWVMRHGEAENNTGQVLDSAPTSTMRLTPRGELQVARAAKALADQGIDLIISSDLERTKETAHAVARALGLPTVSYDKRLREIGMGDLVGEPRSEYTPYAIGAGASVSSHPLHGESMRDVRRRIWHLLEELERTYTGRRILFISHEYPLWALQTVAEGIPDEEALHELRIDNDNYLRNAEHHRLFYRAMPRNGHGELDLHRPYVDDVTFPCTHVSRGTKCVGTMHRVPEVIDGWFDSGSMPLAQQHYPFENRKLIDGRVEYPADFIAEGMDQTRGWFYLMMAVATLLGLPAPYRNVISNGLVNDKNGQKMSKSKGNIVDPWITIQKYGVDAVRWYFFAVNDPGDVKNFDENDIVKLFRKMHLIFYNSVSFYSLYARDKEGGRAAARVTPTLLDRWILARLRETVTRVTAAFDAYDIRGAAVAIEAFLDDLSRWYIRVSRRRFQRPVSVADHVAASRTLHDILLAMTKLLAPFTPFFAEACYQPLRQAGDPVSVHLTDWPHAGGAAAATAKSSKTEKQLLADMALIRETAAQALAKRAEAGIRVRQPLASLIVKNKAVVKHRQLVEILKAETNVKEVVVHAPLEEVVALDTAITPELRDEGMLREFLRAVQELRQKANLAPTDQIELAIAGAEKGTALLRAHEAEIKKDARAKRVVYKRTAQAQAEAELSIDRHKVWLGVRKV